MAVNSFARPAEEPPKPGRGCGFSRLWVLKVLLVQLIVIVVAMPMFLHHQHSIGKGEHPWNPMLRPPMEHQTEYPKEEVEMKFDWMNERLIGPPVSAIDYGVNKVDYEKWFVPQDIETSVKYMDDNASVLVPYANRLLATRHREAKMQCNNARSMVALERGGWCLESSKDDKPLMDTGYSIPREHKLGSRRIIKELSNLIVAEKINSINDFGAGVGQYKPEILQLHPTLDYEAYDGAGNIDAYTHGNVKFFDLTLPLGLPKREWVLSLEVGEHIPSIFEGMLIRNLHRHNTKGIILSWGVLGQDGYHHINNHSNKYVIDLFESLGYEYQKEWSEKFRNPDDNYFWFVGSTMVFKRKNILG